MSDKFPDPMILAILLPLFGAVAAFVLPRAASAIGLATLAATTASVALLGRAVAQAGAVSLPLAGWGAPLGIELRADGLALAMLALTALIGIAVGLGAVGTFARTHRPPEGMAASRHSVSAPFSGRSACFC